MIKCATCTWLDYYPPDHKYIKSSDGKHRCHLNGGSCVDITKDTKEELENKSLQHVCLYRKSKLPVQLELAF